MGDFSGNIISELGKVGDSFQRQVEGLSTTTQNSQSAQSSDTNETGQGAVPQSHALKQSQTDDRIAQLRSQLATKGGKSPQFHQNMQRLDQEILDLYHQRQQEDESRRQQEEEQKIITARQQEAVRNEQMARLQQQLTNERGNGAGETTKRTG